MKNPNFIVFEGLDACGKSTISTKFAEKHHMRLMGALPPEIKGWLAGIASTGMPEATFSYFTLCNLLRAQEITKRLADGERIVLDRFFYTSYCYHKFLLNGDMPNSIKEVYRFQDLPKPDLVVFLDVPHHVRKQRIANREGDLQWYGDQVSMQVDLTDSYFELFQELGVEVLRVDNHVNSVEQTLAVISEHFDRRQNRPSVA